MRGQGSISYAGMRAQNNPSAGWRALAFIGGFPGTLLTYLTVPEGGERAYGIAVPKKRQAERVASVLLPRHYLATTSVQPAPRAGFGGADP